MLSATVLMALPRDLRKEPLLLKPGSLHNDQEIVQTTRVGISKANDKPWRFYIKDNPYVS